MVDQLSLGAWAPPLRADLGQFHTPVKLAQKMVAWAGVRNGDAVLEPSAGGGNIVRELQKVGARVTAVEIDLPWAQVLRSEFPTVSVHECDFLRMGVFDHDAALMNPPLSGGVGPSHVAHALSMVPLVVSVLRLSDLVGDEHCRVLWDPYELTRLALLRHRPLFTGDGGKTDFCVVEVGHRDTGRPRQYTIEHWMERWDG